MKKEQKAPVLPPARIVSRKEAFKRYYTLEVVEAEPRSLQHDGYIAMIEREVLRGKGVTAVLLYCPETDELLLNQQFRMGAFLAGDENPFMFECAAGAIDAGENPEDAARREALEETGCAVLHIEPAGWFYTSPGALEERINLFIGRIAKPIAGFHGVEEEGEEIKTHIVSVAKALAMLDDGTIRNATTMLSLYWFIRNRDRLRKKWGFAS